MEYFKYSHTLETFYHSGELLENYMTINWKIIVSEVIVTHNLKGLDTPLHDLIDTVKEEVLEYCGNPEELRKLLENIH